MNELTPIEEQDQEYERAVTHESKEKAEKHVLDVLCILEAEIKELRKKLDDSHSGVVRPCYATRNQAGGLMNALLEMLPEFIDIDYETLVGQTDWKDNLLLREEYIVDEVRTHVRGFLKWLMPKDEATAE